MNILNIVTREQVQALCDSGFALKQAVKHYDICKELQDGKPMQEVADEHNMDIRNVKYIKSKCYSCDQESRPISFEHMKRKIKNLVKGK